MHASSQVVVERLELPLQPELPVRRIRRLTLAIAIVQQFLLVAIGAGVDLWRHQPVSWQGLFIRNLSQWDSRWLLQIARHGYTDLAHTAFFPLYPLTIRLLHDITEVNYTLCGLAVSLISFLIALYMLGLWVYRQFGLRAAGVSMALLALFPTAFYFRAVYTESLFLALSLLGVYASSRNRFLTAGILISLATLTRNTGILLDVVLLCDYLAVRGLDWRFWRGEWWRKLNTQALSLIVPVAVLALYLVWLRLHTGYFLAFTHAEQIWHRTDLFPWQTLVRAFAQLFLPGQTALLPYHVMEVASWLFLAAAACIGIGFARKSAHQLGNWTYLVIFLCVCLSAPAHAGTALGHWDYLLSVPRFVLMMYPAFAYLATRLRSRITVVGGLMVSMLAFAVVYGAFCEGHFVA